MVSAAFRQMEELRRTDLRLVASTSNVSAPSECVSRSTQLLSKRRELKYNK
jgi:hypothetical protein